MTKSKKYQESIFIHIPIQIFFLATLQNANIFLQYYFP